ncbi:hypothetical protein GCM10008018_07590 [Paenibacillus marchantiophytorum]|uniref:Uncharacterized protein n=1 Tax=Paenibacillus marchantiophytorum TaxID=1619310 RepID=A0ABQ2BPK9_9BACL|nr:hypothetical protein GCM10008018_07590 [Paenibacillus marchantiophytorum]
MEINLFKVTNSIKGTVGSYVSSYSSKGTRIRYNAESRQIPLQKELQSAISPFPGRNEHVPLK